MPNQYFTIGQIFRGGLLKNHKGKPYSHKSTVGRIVSKLEPKILKTPWGTSACLTQQQIKDYNKSILCLK